ALGTRSYPIRIGAGLLSDATAWRTAIRGRHALVVSNETVAPLYLERVQAGLDGLTQAALILPDGEAHKTLASAARIFDALAALGAGRDATVIALGGGVVGDLAGFAAATWMRGVALVQMPTTLLAMVDSSVGGKTAVNLPQGKNLVGAFHQPQAVFADTDTLTTLPARELRAGFAEIVKCAAIGDAAWFAGLEADVEALNARNRAAVAATIEAGCRHKAGVVARDECEHGERALLNFGHTFAHALEAESAYAGLLHGEAVAVGMVLAARLATLLGRAPATDAGRLAVLLHRFGLPTTLSANCEPDALIEHMRLDKKSLGGRLRLILWRGVGRAEIVDDVEVAAIRKILAAGG
ncbi:MAG TPA: 3-dehydroquinate synthase, partial [Rhodanobacteraceae bacterium]|nr:3-dehydroquinate synthase [Rhodanobacteraceae bacterium]